MDSASPEKSAEEILLEESDYYGVLGVPKDASDKQITAAYKKLALKFHPDRNIDDSYAAAKYEAVITAYQTLIDPTKKALYDTRHEPSAPAPPTEAESVDVSGLGGLGRVFGAVMSRLGSITINTSIAADILETAQHICKNGGIEGGGPPLDPRVSDLAWGWPVDGKADRQAGVFYRLTVDAQHRESGFFLHARSQNKDKFKLLMFDKEGTLLYSEDCHKSKSNTYANLFFTTFDTYSLPESPVAATTATGAAGGTGSTAAPASLSRLEGFSAGPKVLKEGQYLVCVYGDNFMSKASFTLMALRANSTAPQVSSIEETDDQLVELQASMAQLKADYQKARDAYEAVCEVVRSESERLEDLLKRREQLYGEFVEHCMVAFAPQPLETAPSALTGSVQKLASNVSSLLHSITPANIAGGAGKPSEDAATPAGAASQAAAPGAQRSSSPTSGHNPLSALTAGTLSAASSVTSNAQAATGWLARRLSLGLQSMTQRQTAEQDSSPTPVEQTETAAPQSDVPSTTDGVSAEEAAAPASVEESASSEVQAPAESTDTANPTD